MSRRYSNACWMDETTMGRGGMSVAGTGGVVRGVVVLKGG